MTDPAIIEAAARVLSQTDIDGDDSTLWEDCAPMAERVLNAVAPLIEASALERAAKVAEDTRWEKWRGAAGVPEAIAAAIRALKQEAGD